MRDIHVAVVLFDKGVFSNLIPGAISVVLKFRSLKRRTGI